MPSYNHLYLADTAADVLSHKQELLYMAQRLEELGLESAFNETLSIWSEIMCFEEVLQARVNQVRDLWKHIEWFDSGYCDAGSVQRAFNDFVMSGVHVVKGDV